MTWPNRFRLLLGLIAIAIIVAGATLVFNQRQLRAQSVSAQISAQEYSVGSSYAGTVVEQKVQTGDAVIAGDVLFRVRSPLLARDLGADSDTPVAIDGQVTPDGTYEITASVDGIVSDVLTPAGDFAASGTPLATLEKSDTMTIDADFVLSPRDYERVSIGSAVDVTMPDNQRFTGRVTTIDVATTGGQATSTLTIESPALTSNADTGLFTPGTPVQVTVQLRDDGPLAGVSDAFRAFVQRVGL